MMTYSPTNLLYQGIGKVFPPELCPWDDYYPRMAQTDYFDGRGELFASKTFFIRKAPFGGSFAILGGLTEFVRALVGYEFTAEVARALEDMGYRPQFIDYLRRKRVPRLRVFSVREGSIFLPNEPAIVLEGDLISLRFAEGIMLKSVNFPSLSMTKWQRVVSASHPGKVMEFSRRRAQDSLRTSLYAHLAGCELSSNAEIRRGFDIPVTGTMGHEFVQGWGDEYRAFDNWLEVNPERPVLLIDTINTLKSGLPNAIRAFTKHLQRITDAGGFDRMAMRNDSGDLAYLTIEERTRLDEAGLGNVQIIQTNDLDEYAIQHIKQQIFIECNSGGIDPNRVLSRIIWACGTRPGTCYDQPSIGGVAKLTSIAADGKNEKAVIKLSDNPAKTSIPGSNRSSLVWVGDELLCCLIHGRDEDPSESPRAVHPDDDHRFLPLNGDLVFEPRQSLIYNNYDQPEEDEAWIPPELTGATLEDVREHVHREVGRLHWSCRRLEKPHVIKVSLTERLFQFRKAMIAAKQLIER